MGSGVKYLGAAAAVVILAGGIVGGMMMADGADNPSDGGSVRGRLPLPGPSGSARAETVDLDGATRAYVEVDLEIGTLRLAGGTLAGAGEPLAPWQLLRAEFAAGPGAGPGPDGGGPTLDYRVDAEQRVGVLRLAQAPDAAWVGPWHDRAERWDLYLNPTIPTDLRLRIGAGDTRLALGGLSLSALDAQIGAGPTTVDFAGDWRRGFAGRIHGGGGDLAIRLPQGVGVRVALRHGKGEVAIDGFRVDDGAYVNDAYGDSPITIDLAVEHDAGDIRLEAVD